ncbi:antagonist of mitotic exit network protein 1 [Diutina rugosa]
MYRKPDPGPSGYRVAKRPSIRRHRRTDSAASLVRSPSVCDVSSDDSTSLDSPPSTPYDPQEPAYFDARPTTPQTIPAAVRLGDVPEIVHRIFQYVDHATVVPEEGCVVRRRPLSFDHAMLIHQSTQKAVSVLKHSPTTSAGLEVSASSAQALANCMMVNRLWCSIAKAVIGERVLFANERNWHRLTAQPQPYRHLNRPKQVVLHKLVHARQPSIESIKHADYSRLTWLELYMCPKLAPPVEMLVASLEKIVITGSKTVDDHFLQMVGRRCPNLRTLDLRACELISDSGVYHVATGCRQLRTLNLGRKHKGHLITDTSISAVARHCRHLATVGLAGCHITDHSVWELAAHCSDSLQRLSLNNCRLLTDHSVPHILSRPHPSFFQHLTVLELSHTNLSHWRPVIEFKRRQQYKGLAMVVHVDQALEHQWRATEMEMDKVISQRMFSDILHWANDPDDGDMPYHTLLKHSQH